MSFSLIDSDQCVSDNIGNIATVLRFLEETAFNYSTHTVPPREYAYTAEGWAGFYAVISMARTSLESLARNPRLNNIKTN